MRSSQVIRFLGVAATVAFAVAALNLSANRIDVPGAASETSISQDFLVLPSVAAAGMQQSAPSVDTAAVETLSDWEFTLRSRPAKCRFIE